jgi:hypothetical protein
MAVCHAERRDASRQLPGLETLHSTQGDMGYRSGSFGMIGLAGSLSYSHVITSAPWMDTHERWSSTEVCDELVRVTIGDELLGRLGAHGY